MPKTFLFAGDLLTFLRKFEIEFWGDVRNFGRSHWVQFNGAVLAENLRENGIGDEHLPESRGKILAQTEDLERRLERISELSAEVGTAIKYSESQPLKKHKIPRAKRHRVGLLSPLLKAKGAKHIIHILPNGDPTEFDEPAVLSI